MELIPDIDEKTEFNTNKLNTRRPDKINHIKKIENKKLKINSKEYKILKRKDNKVL